MGGKMDLFRRVISSQSDALDSLHVVRSVNENGFLRIEGRLVASLQG